MCTKYNLKDDPDIFKQFIPRNLSHTELSDDVFQTKYAWCLMSNDFSQCECKYPKLSDLKNFRMCRKDLFNDQIDGCKSKRIKFEKCWMCKGSSSYFPNDVDMDLNGRKAKSDIILKSTKHRKSVRFADALGLELTEIKIIKNSDSEKAPILSSSAIRDLNLDHNLHLGMQGTKYFSPFFKILPDENALYQKTITNSVCLEAVYIEGMNLFGRILVKNISFEKNVGIRITFDNWKSFKDIYASYVLESSDGMIDKFCFSVVIPRFVVVDSRIEFAAFYLTQESTRFWDNNDNQNYIFECFAKNMGFVTDDGWLHFL